MMLADQLRKANSLVSQGNTDQAWAMVQPLLRDHPTSGKVHYLAGRIFLTRKDLAKALTAAQRAYELEKGEAYAAALLAEVYVDLNLPEYALPMLLKTIAQVPDDRGTHYTLGRCYMLMEKGYKALPHFEAANTGEWGDTSGKILISLAQCLNAIGRPADATAALDTVFTHEPDNAEALFERGMSVAKPVPEWLKSKLEAFATSEVESRDARSNAWLALGRCLDVEGKHIEAFDCWSKSRALLGVERFKPETIVRQLNQTRGFYAKAFLDAAAPFGDRETNPIFVVGMPRSGTTLTTQVISAHPACINIGESDRFDRFDALFRKDFWRETGHRDILQGAKGGLLRNIAKEFGQFFDIFAEGDKKRVVEKSPFNFEHMGFIHLIFPTAKFVHCRRHPADNFVSAFQHNMNRSHDYSYSQETYVERYLAHEELMRYWKKCFPGQIFELRYEDMVADQEGTSRKLISFCGLPWDDACLNFHEQKSTVRTFSQAQVRQPVYKSSVERWRRYEDRLGPLFAKLKQHGYDYAASAI